MTGLPTHPEPFVTRQELAKRMGISTSMVDRLRREGMPSVVWGSRTRRFLPSTAIAWAQNRVLRSEDEQMAPRHTNEMPGARISRIGG